MAPSRLSEILYEEAARATDPAYAARLKWLGDRESLRVEITECVACPLAGESTQRVPFAGSSEAVVIVGEAPGADEDRLGVPFVGRSGQLLRGLLASVFGELFDPMIVNSVCCRPPANNYDVALEVGAVEACSGFLRRQLELSGSWVVLCVGGRAYQAVTGGGLSVAAARLQPRWVDGRVVITTYHPAYAQRVPSARGFIEDDLRRVRRVLDGSEVVRGELRPGSPMTRDLSPVEYPEWNRALRREGYSLMWSAVLGEQIAVVTDPAVRVPEVFGDVVSWTVEELARAKALLNGGGLAQLRRVHEVKRQFPGAQVL